MEAIEDALRLGAVVEMKPADVVAGCALSEEAGWNQTAADWSLMIRLGRAFAFALPGAERRLVATAVALPYPSDLGWISMVLTHEPYRRRGIASRLLDRSLCALHDLRLTALLDATPAGRAVYERLGFHPVDSLTRWRGSGSGEAPRTRPASPVRDAAALGDLDRAAFGSDRAAVLADLLERPGAVSRSDPDGHGFLLSRAGRTATHIGPVVARSEEIACDLLTGGLAEISGPVVIDVPDRQSRAGELLAALGLRPERGFTRMVRGRDTGFGDPSLVHAVAGPELG